MTKSSYPFRSYLTRIFIGHALIKQHTVSANLMWSLRAVDCSMHLQVIKETRIACVKCVAPVNDAWSYAGSIQALVPLQCFHYTPSCVSSLSTGYQFSNAKF